MKRVAFCLLLPLALTGCAGLQSALDPKGPAATQLAELIWFFTLLCSAIWILVMIALGLTLVRRGRLASDPLALDFAGERRRFNAVTAAVGVTAMILVLLTLLSFFANQSLAHIGDEAKLTIRITGHQWWWEARYENSEPSRILTTANEIHIPAGEPVRLVLRSNDVIHSFWVPALNGKLDLIPGLENVLTVQADKAGIYRGQCAEFCGIQHAHMALLVVAEPKARFEAWLSEQLKPAAEPKTQEQRAGHELFMKRPCVMCHRIQGTSAGGTVAPDLTHVASRRTLAAATLKMSKGNLAAWIADPQSVKPGSNMPVIPLNGDELNMIVAYVESLR